RLRDERITMAHGAGGKATATLIEALFLDAFRNPLLAPLEDQAVFDVEGARLAFTTDSFVVSPLFSRVGTLATWRSTGRSMIWRSPALDPFISRQDLFLKRASRWRTCSASCTRWPRRQPPLAWPLRPAILKWCNGARLTGASSTRPG